MHAFDRQTDGRTDGRTDRNLIVRPRCIPCSAVKIDKLSVATFFVNKCLSLAVTLANLKQFLAQIAEFIVL